MTEWKQPETTHLPALESHFSSQEDRFRTEGEIEDFSTDSHSGVDLRLEALEIAYFQGEGTRELAAHTKLVGIAGALEGRGLLNPGAVKQVVLKLVGQASLVPALAEPSHEVAIGRCEGRKRPTGKEQVENQMIEPHVVSFEKGGADERTLPLEVKKVKS